MDDDDADDPNKADDNTHKGDNISHDHLGQMDELKIYMVTTCKTIILQPDKI